MSTLNDDHNVHRATADILARIPGVRSEADGWGILRDLVTALAKNSADNMFWKVSSEMDWTPAGISNLAEKSIELNTVAIAETLHQFGGTLDQVHALNEVWVEAYQHRLRDLAVGEMVGGCA